MKQNMDFTSPNTKKVPLLTLHFVKKNLYRVIPHLLYFLITNLHSSIFILKRKDEEEAKAICINLHSSIFILKQKNIKREMT